MLEGRTFLQWLHHLARSDPGSRAYGIVDSRVTLGSTAKGRSSSVAISKLLRQGAAVQLAAGLYPRLGFGPTRFNVADDPTRDAPIREPDHQPPGWMGSPAALDVLLRTSPGKGPLVNWVRLVASLLPEASWGVLALPRCRAGALPLPPPLSLAPRAAAETGKPERLAQPVAEASLAADLEQPRRRG